MKTIIKLYCFDKNTDFLIEEYEVSKDFKKDLIALFNTSSLIGGTLISENEKQFISKIVGQDIDLKKYEYVLEEVEDIVIDLDDCDWREGYKPDKPEDEL